MCHAAFCPPVRPPYNARRRYASMATISASRTLICRERVVSVERQEKSSRCVLANQTAFLVTRFVGSHIAVGDEIAFPVPMGDAVGPEILVTKNATPGRNVISTRRQSDTSASPNRTNEISTSFLPRFHGRLGIGTVFLPCEVLREYFYRLPARRRQARHPTLYDILRIPASASPSELRVAFKLRDLELKTAGARTQSEWRWSGHLTSLAIPNCALATTRCWPIPKPLPYFRMVDLALFSLPASLPVTEKHSLPAASSRFHRISGAGGSMCHCADVISTMTGHCAAMCVASSSSGSIQPPSIHSGTAHGTSGSICWEPRSRSRARSYRAGKYRKRRGEWDLVTWETALPSRLEVKLPPDFQQQMESAKSDLSSLRPVLAGSGSDPLAPGASGGRESRAAANVFRAASSG